MNAEEVIALLAERHAGDTFVPECKVGQSGSRRLDAWVLRATWSPVTTIGYEVKVSRSDWLADTKWPTYLDVCHQFYLVAPPKVVAVAEVPEGVGLLVAGKRLVTRVKAARREPDQKALMRLMTYVLMSRCQVKANMWEPRQSQAEFWRAWLATRHEHANLGRSVSRKLGQQVGVARERAAAAEGALQQVEWFRKALRSRGIDPDAAPSSWAAQRDVDQMLGLLQRHIGPGLRRDLVSLRDRLSRTIIDVEDAMGVKP